MKAFLISSFVKWLLHTNLWLFCFDNMVTVLYGRLLTVLVVVDATLWLTCKVEEVFGTAHPVISLLREGLMGPPQEQSLTEFHHVASLTIADEYHAT